MRQVGYLQRLTVCDTFIAQEIVGLKYVSDRNIPEA